MCVCVSKGRCISDTWDVREGQMAGGGSLTARVQQTRGADEWMWDPVNPISSSINIKTMQAKKLITPKG